MLPDPIITPEAQEQIEQIDGWWQEHRRAAPDLFVQELASTLQTIRTLFYAGRRVPHRVVQDLRRVVMRATRYHVYYVVAAERIFVLAVWSALRGHMLPLRRSAQH